ncbi:nuclear transport factor 2 family protein [Streptomyces sp. NRRL S-340]|uniref:nuclear transport factor 2 family protein n=1 Tax=Streptomyces sp. NRRL S-340 TaxID=1463901 RepID=UPI00056853FE|nr:nuclear transport factor 2 family protein [Streptomyces sp. NRRL S-340]
MPVATHTDLDQIRDLKARYARYADTKQWEKVAGLFTDDAVMRFRDVDGNLTHEVTAAEFARTIGSRVGAGQPVHHLFSHEVTFASDTTAQGVWAMEDLIFHDREAHPKAPFSFMHGFGHYHDTYRKIDGEWYISGSELTRLRMEIVD